MQKFTLSDERKRLLVKVAKKEKDPIEIVLCTVVSLILFIYVSLLIRGEFRYEDSFLALLLGPGVVALICVGLCATAYGKLKLAQQGQVVDRRNLFVNLAICSCGALAAGMIIGDRSYWLYGTNIFSYRDLVSYVDIDPAKDNGQSYMDSGIVYFKEHSYVLRQKFNKFRNGDTYCVAPIVKGQMAGGSSTQTAKSLVLPESGTYDWWAVGTNCCEGSAAANFTCGAVTSPLARSGMRLLSDTQRPYYLLAVQEWSATYGLPVKHPLFFEWVKDPLGTEDQNKEDAEQLFWTSTWWFVLCAFLVSFLLHMFMHQNKIY